MGSSLPPLVPVQLPSPTETHLWYLLPNEVKRKPLIDQYLEFLSPCEKEYVFSMRGEELRKRALLARALTNPEVNPRSLKFRKNIHGKPEVDWQHSDDWNPPPMNFNLSHTSSLIACGVTLDSQIGIDVEEKQWKTKNNILAFAWRYFSRYEVELLTAISDLEVQCQEFIILWTLKEAYVKALGRGFSGSPFKIFTIQFRATVTGNLHPSGNIKSK
ncbi:unnamed protein product [Ilex paraguariensis]|uniref:holo-[acyl-carrier-protein] synthase n=1 Tax=Ilex paraguariensis TaxID=185542 RepID=A0ABC8RSE4_9AQUA